jgi:hypothetical protein
MPPGTTKPPPRSRRTSGGGSSVDGRSGSDANEHPVPLPGFECGRLDVEFLTRDLPNLSHPVDRVALVIVATDHFVPVARLDVGQEFPDGRFIRLAAALFGRNWHVRISDRNGRERHGLRPLCVGDWDHRSTWGLAGGGCGCFPRHGVSVPDSHCQREHQGPL